MIISAAQQRISLSMFFVLLLTQCYSRGPMAVVELYDWVGRVSV